MNSFVGYILLALSITGSYFFLRFYKAKKYKISILLFFIFLVVMIAFVLLVFYPFDKGKVYLLDEIGYQILIPGEVKATRRSVNDDPTLTIINIESSLEDASYNILLFKYIEIVDISKKQEVVDNFLDSLNDSDNLIVNEIREFEKDSMQYNQISLNNTKNNTEGIIQAIIGESFVIVLSEFNHVIEDSIFINSFQKIKS